MVIVAAETEPDGSDTHSNTTKHVHCNEIHKVSNNTNG